jgi:hypothetical protein
LTEIEDAPAEPSDGLPRINGVRQNEISGFSYASELHLAAVIVGNKCLLLRCSSRRQPLSSSFGGNLEEDDGEQRWRYETAERGDSAKVADPIDDE